MNIDARSRAFSTPEVFDHYLQRLESYYVPPWSVYDMVASRVTPHVAAVCDFGCGTGLLARKLAEHGPMIDYVGLDQDSTRVLYAATTAPWAVFTADPDEFVRIVSGKTSQLFVSTFCLHDQPSLDEVLGLIAQIRPAEVVAWDLTPGDLPRLTAWIRSSVATTTRGEPRGRILEFADELAKTGRDVRTARREHDVVFPTSQAVLDYVAAFRLLQGDDLGVNIGDVNQFCQMLSDLEVPFHDQRKFVEVYAR